MSPEVWEPDPIWANPPTDELDSYFSTEDTVYKAFLDGVQVDYTLWQSREEIQHWDLDTLFNQRPQDRLEQEFRLVKITRMYCGRCQHFGRIAGMNEVPVLNTLCQPCQIEKHEKRSAQHAQLIAELQDRQAQLRHLVADAARVDNWVCSHCCRILPGEMLECKGCGCPRTEAQDV